MSAGSLVSSATHGSLTALQYCCRATAPLATGVFEKDDRHGAADFGLEARRAPADLKHVLADVEFLQYQRRPFLAAAMAAKLGELLGTDGGGALAGTR
eukprot:SAG22_NODE_1147_length_5370_cov_3.083855_2_plen_98_part_00